MDKKKSVQIFQWLKSNPGIFLHQEEEDEIQLKESFSQKELFFKEKELEKVEERKNNLNPLESYLILLFHSGQQCVLSQQGFAFGPDFTNTGPLSLPASVYCMKDFYNLYDKLTHLASEEDRRKEALELLLVLIAILDGAKQIGLNVEAEEFQVEKILAQLEKGAILPPPH